MSVLDTIFLPFQNGLLTFDTSALFLGARMHPALRNFKNPKPWQAFYPHACAFGSGADVLPDGTWDTVLVNIPKQADQARGWLAYGLSRLSPGGILVAAAANDANGSRLEKWFKELGLSPSSLAKNHAKVVWAINENPSSDVAQKWREQAGKRALLFSDGQNYLTQPGVFSWDRLDAGTEFLLHYLPQQKAGNGADFGCGIGVLSRHFMNQNSMNQWHILDADALALSCARENLSAFSNVHFHWTDLTVPQKNFPPLDIIVMNPPFHDGKGADDAIGQAFIRTAAQALKTGGTLLMVANAHLPYEKTLQNLFSVVTQTAQNGRFKIIEAVK